LDLRQPAIILLDFDGLACGGSAVVRVEVDVAAGGEVDLAVDVVSFASSQRGRTGRRRLEH